MRELWARINGKRIAGALLLTLLLALVPACFEATQALSDGGAVMQLGLPIAFYNVRALSAGGFGVHLNPLALIADIALCDAALWLLGRGWQWIKARR